MPTEGEKRRAVKRMMSDFEQELAEVASVDLLEVPHQVRAHGVAFQVQSDLEQEVLDAQEDGDFDGANGLKLARAWSRLGFLLLVAAPSIRPQMYKLLERNWAGLCQPGDEKL